MLYTSGKGISILKQEIVALVAFCDGKREENSDINFRVHAGKLHAWASDGSNLALATGEARGSDIDTRPSTDNYDWMIHYAALEAAAKTMGSKDEALIRIGRGGAIRDVKIFDIETGEERCTVGIPAGSVSTQTSITCTAESLVSCIRVQGLAATTWAMSPSSLRLVAIAARACEALEVTMYAPRSPIDPIGVVIADGTWQLVLMPRVSDGEKRAEAAEEMTDDTVDDSSKESDILRYDTQSEAMPDDTGDLDPDEIDRELKKRAKKKRAEDAAASNSAPKKRAKRSKKPLDESDGEEEE